MTRLFMNRGESSLCLAHFTTSRNSVNQLIHYSLLATVEPIFNLGTRGRNDTSATPMSDLFRGGIP
jgi:hypothetical protein